MKKSSAKLWMMAAATSPLTALAANSAGKETIFSNALFNTMLVVIILLAVIVLALAAAIRNFIGSDMFAQKLQRSGSEKRSSRATLLAGALLLSAAGYAQADVQPARIDASIGGLDQAVFYTMVAIITAELLVIAVLLRTFRLMIGRPEKIHLPAPPKRKPILDKINSTVAIEDEQKVLLDHEYDGIRELDNVLPPWWKYGFYVTIVVAFVYMVVYHVTGTFPLQKAEYETSVEKARIEVEEYMKNSAANVDETTITMLTDPADLTTGKDLFVSSCAPCHGRSGEGGVGPNLTDDYWMHSGGIADIFKSIKYGWPDKGMKSWKEDFSPMQIAQLSSYIKSLRGSNPPNAKEKQGELYNDIPSQADSLVQKRDSPDRLTSQALR